MMTVDGQETSKFGQTSGEMEVSYRLQADKTIVINDEFFIGNHI